MDILRPDTLVIIEFFLCAAMTGVIWQVQLVSYPLLQSIPSAELVSFHKEYVGRISLVVLPLMCLELLVTIILLFYVVKIGSFIGTILLLICWSSTFFLSVPSHQMIAKGNKDEIAKLLKTNWIRTLGWSMRSVILFAQLIKVSQHSIITVVLQSN